MANIRPRSGGRSFLSLCPGPDYRKEGATLNLAHFSQFCNEKFHLSTRARRLQDARKKRVIPTWMLYMFLVGSAALRKKSLHQIDLFARQKEARAWLGSDRYMVASDATYYRVLPGIDRRQLREDLQQAYVLLRQQGHGKILLPGGRQIRAAAVDGSVFSGQYASAVEVLGAHAAVIDLEPCEGKGKELPASERALRRTFGRHGKGFVDIVLGDGLYVTQKMMRLCRDELDTDLLVKIKDTDPLDLKDDAQALFDGGPEFAAQIEHVRGTDTERGMQYEVWAARGFHHAGYPGELKVARVRVRMLKGPRKGSVETFWIVTTDVTLSAEQMRELAHLRWSIENHGFRALNDQVNSKHQWARGKDVAERVEALMLILFVSFLLVLAYHAHLDKDALWEERRLRRVTLGYLGECWLLTLQKAAGAFALDSG